MLTTTHLLYLHGFRSSPQSTKAQQLGQRVRTQHPGVHWWCPALPVSPRAAMALLLDGTADWPREQMAVVGSSLGGFYARVLSHRLGCRSALINLPPTPPGTCSATSVNTPLGTIPKRSCTFSRRLSGNCANGKTPCTSLAWSVTVSGSATGPSWPKATRCWTGVKCKRFVPTPNVRLLPGSDHALSDFEDHMDALVDFLNLAPGTGTLTIRACMGQ